jgi:hypothetical protein
MLCRKMPGQYGRRGQKVAGSGCFGQNGQEDFLDEENETQTGAVTGQKDTETAQAPGVGFFYQVCSSSPTSGA